MIGLVRQSLRFGAVGVVNTAIGLTAIYALMFFFGVGPILANAVGYAIGLVISFAPNRLPMCYPNTYWRQPFAIC
jgi:putative flippase GtrA